MTSYIVTPGQRTAMPAYPNLDHVDKAASGRAMWTVMRMAAQALGPSPSPEMVAQTKEFYEHLSRTMTCGGCRIHYRKALSELTTELISKGTISVAWWIEDLRKSVDAIKSTTDARRQEIVTKLLAAREAATRNIISSSSVAVGAPTPKNGAHQ